MSIKEVTMYTVICDRCGSDVGKDQEICAWLHKVSALGRAIDDHGWEHIDGKDFCTDCIEWNDDETALIPKKEPLQ